MIRGGKDSHIKRGGMLVVSLGGVNFRFWSHLGCSGQNVIVRSHEGLLLGFARKNIKVYIYYVYLILFIYLTDSCSRSSL